MCISLICLVTESQSFRQMNANMRCNLATSNTTSINLSLNVKKKKKKQTTTTSTRFQLMLHPPQISVQSKMCSHEVYIECHKTKLYFTHHMQLAQFEFRVNKRKQIKLKERVHQTAVISGVLMGRLETSPPLHCRCIKT